MTNVKQNNPILAYGITGSGLLLFRTQILAMRYDFIKKQFSLHKPKKKKKKAPWPQLLRLQGGDRGKGLSRASEFLSTPEVSRSQAGKRQPKVSPCGQQQT